MREAHGSRRGRSGRAGFAEGDRRAAAGRFVEGGEVELATWQTFASEDLLRQVVVERMLAGVATRRHVDVTEPVGAIEGRATSKSAVSRRFKAATEAARVSCWAGDLTELGRRCR